MTSYGAGLVTENKRGMQHGGIPVAALLHKLEETDPDLVDEVRDRDEFRDSDYNDYARGEIVAWGPDAPLFDSDHARRDPSLSRSRLNLRYGGTRGTVSDARHPDLFMGFTGNDPRGADNTPRFDLYRAQTMARAGNLTARMGDNDDNAIAESPWTAQSISAGMQKRMQRTRRDMKIFTEQREGAVQGRNFAANSRAAGDVRAMAAQGGAESLQGAGARFVDGDHAPVNGAQCGGVRGVDSGRAGFESAPWRFTVPDADLGVQQYGSQTGGGRAQVGAEAQAARFAPSDQAWGASAKTLSANRQTLGAGMAAAARYAAAARSATPDQAVGFTFEAAGVGAAAGLAPAADVAKLYRHVAEDQARLPTAELHGGDPRGATPGADLGRALRHVEARATPNSHLTNVGAIVAGLREGSAASRRAIANHVVAAGARAGPLSEGFANFGKGVAQGADTARVSGLATAAGARHLALSERSTAAQRGVAPGADTARVAGLAVASGTRQLALSEREWAAQRGVAPGADYGSVARLAAAPLARAAAADGLVVQTYRAAPLAVEHRAAHAHASGTAAWAGSDEAAPFGRSKPAEWRSATQADVSLGDKQSRTFGLDTGEMGDHGAPVGPKSLRAGGWSDGVGLTDELGRGFDDDLGDSGFGGDGVLL